MSRAPLDGPELRAMVDACPLAVWALSLDGAVQCANRAAEEVNLPGAVWRDGWPEEARLSAERALEAARAGETAVFRACIAWGARGRAYVETTVSPVLTADGGVCALAACARDITAERDRSAFLNSIIQMLPMSLTVRDLVTGRYVLSNPFAEELFCRPPGALIGRTVEEAFPTRAARILELDAEAIDTGRSRIVVETAARDAHGRLRKLAATRVATYDDTGPRYLINLAEDITEAEAAAESLRAALREAEQANRAKNAFLANISHEIRTPLHGVIASADMLAQRDPPEALRELIDLMRTSSLALEAKLQTVLELVDLDQERIALNVAPFDVGRLMEAVAAAARHQARTKGLEVALEMNGLSGVVYRGDANRIRQVLDQLLDNAVKFTDRGGLTLAVDAMSDGLRFSVKDTGMGVDDGAEARLFDRFRQADESLTRAHGGFGLGLALSRELVALMDGRIGCEPRAGGGSVFWFEAPLQKEAAPGGCPWSAGTPQILVADDHPTNRRLVELVLGPLAHVHSVNDGLQAVEAAAGQAFDLILMDIQMPVLDGVSAVAEIRRFETAQRRRRTPIAMLTANTDPVNLAASLAAGADRYIAKPFTAGLLISSVRDLLGGAAQFGANIL